MSISNGKQKTKRKFLHYPLTRMVVGVIVCGLAILGTNSILKLVLASEMDTVRIIRWLLSALVMLSVYNFLFKYYERREITELSKTGLVMEGLIGLMAGALSIGLVVAILFLGGYYKVFSANNISALIMLLFLYITLSVLEEVVFRGIIYRIVEESLGTNLALIISAVLFGFGHIFNENANIISVISATLGGILAGLLFSLTKRLWLPIFFHAGWNWALSSLGLVVSGMEELPSFLQGRLEGPEIITGGVFGPENSVITMLVVLVLSGVAYHQTLKRGNVIKRRKIS